MFKIYKSSAGSGKTFTLVKEYLKLALQANSDVAFRRILATTFTNKAANEMKGRVLEALALLATPELVGSKSNILKNLLLEELSISESELQQKSHHVLRAILHNYADFGIGTIDRFTHRIIRTFARDLNLPVNFEVELDNKIIIDKAIELLLAKVGVDDELTNFLIQFAQSKVDNGDKYHLESDIQSIALELLKEDGAVYIKRLKQFGFKDFQSKIDRLKSFNEQFLKEMIGIGQEAHELIEKSGALPASFSNGASGIPGFFKKLKEGQKENLTPNSYVSNTIKNDQWFAGKVKSGSEQYAAIDSIKDQLKDLYNQANDQLSNSYPLFLENDIILDNLYSVALINELDKIIDDLRTTENKVHISEFNKRISNVIAKEPTPFIYERIGEKYHHYLIDEFQDTSVMQFHNLIPLFSNSLSQGYYNMLVGDAKQAIYRFRGGEVEQFVELPDIYKADQNPTVVSSQALFTEVTVTADLNDNFRTKEEIVNFNTEFFDFCVAHSPELEKLYKGHGQTPKNGKGGYAEIHFCAAKAKASFGEEDNEETVEDPEQIEVIIDRIERCISDGYQYKDIALLFRGNTKANQVAKILIDKGYPISSAESVMISNSPAVQLIENVLFSLIYPKEQIYKKSIVDALFNYQYFKEEALDDIYKRLLEEKSILSFWQKVGGDFGDLNKEDITQRPLFEIVENAFRNFGLFNLANPYVQFFLDEVFDYSLSNNNDILGFLNWWTERKEKKSIELPEGLNALNILTIHKSKGLEFPVVIMPYAADRVKVSGGKWVENNTEELPIDQLNFVSVSKKLKDSSFDSIFEAEKRNATIDFFNTLYVAFTRPKDRLYVISNQPPKNPENTSIPSLVSNFLMVKKDWDSSESTSVLAGEEATVKASNVIPDKEVKRLDTFISTDWNEKLTLSYQAPDYWDVNFGEDARQYGNTVHLILSMIKTPNDVEHVLNRLLKQGSITSNQRLVYEAEILQLLNHKTFAPYFLKGLKVKTECDLLTTDGKTFRPDRVVYLNNSVKVIDFKTGKFSEKHKEQLSNYVQLLQQVETQKVTGSLIYIKDLVEVEVFE